MKQSTKFLLEELETNKKSKEPALAVGTTNGTIAGVLTLVLYLFPEIPKNTLMVVFVISAFALPIISGILTRNKVWSPATVAALIKEAVDAALEAKKQLPYSPLTDGPIKKEENDAFRGDSPKE